MRVWALDVVPQQVEECGFARGRDQGVHDALGSGPVQGVQQRGLGRRFVARSEQQHGPERCRGRGQDRMEIRQSESRLDGRQRGLEVALDDRVDGAQHRGLGVVAGPVQDVDLGLGRHRLGAVAPRLGQEQRSSGSAERAAVPKVVREEHTG
jgi:hypothetical protein